MSSHMINSKKYKEQDYEGIFEERFTSVLPPGLEKFNKPVYGTLTIKIGELIFLNTCIKFDNIKVKPVFWGQTKPPFLLRAENTCLSEKGVVFNEAVYEIRCGNKQFYQYLKDMTNLKIFLVDKRCGKAIAVVIVNFLLFMKKDVQEDDVRIFDKISGVYDVYKIPRASEKDVFPPKIGEMELKIDNVFDPRTKFLQAREQKKKQRNDVRVSFKDAENINSSFMIQQVQNEYQNDLANSLKDNTKKYKNPFEVKNQVEGGEVKGGYIDPFSEKSESLDNTFNQKINDLIDVGKRLKKKVLASEKNELDDLSGSLLDVLYDGVGEEPIDPMLDMGKFKSNEAELERLHLLLEDPGFLQSNLQLRNSTMKKKKKRKLGLGDIEKVKIDILNFVATNPVLKSKLKDCRLKLVAKFPICSNARQSKKGKELMEDTYNFVNRGENEDKGIFSFKQEIISDANLRDLGVKDISSKNVHFTLKAKEILPGEVSALGANPKKDDGYVKVCTGSFPYEAALIREDFEVSQRVKMIKHPKFSLDLNEDKLNDRIKRNPNRNKRKRRNPERAEELGYLEINASFYNENFQDFYRATIEQEKPEEIQRDSNQPRITTASHFSKLGKAEFESRYRDDPLLPACLFLHIKESRSMLLRDGMDPNSKSGHGNARNLFLEHKIYGTPDDVRSHVVWDSNNPVFDHRVTMPINFKTLIMTKDIPLAVSVWDKIGLNTPDDLLGFAKVNLESAFSILGHMDQNEIKAFMDSHDNKMVEIFNQHVPIRGLVLNKTKGFLNIMIGLGNIKQIDFYNEMNTPMKTSDRFHEKEENNQIEKINSQLPPIILEEDDPRLRYDPITGNYVQVLPDGTTVKMFKKQVVDSKGVARNIFILANGPHMSAGGLITEENLDSLRDINSQINGSMTGFIEQSVIDELSKDPSGRGGKVPKGKISSRGKPSPRGIPTPRGQQHPQFPPNYPPYPYYPGQPYPPPQYPPQYPNPQANPQPMVIPGTNQYYYPQHNPQQPYPPHPQYPNYYPHMPQPGQFNNSGLPNSQPPVPHPQMPNINHPYLNQDQGPLHPTDPNLLKPPSMVNPNNGLPSKITEESSDRDQISSKRNRDKEGDQKPGIIINNPPGKIIPGNRPKLPSLKPSELESSNSGTDMGDGESIRIPKHESSALEESKNKDEEMKKIPSKKSSVKRRNTIYGSTSSLKNSVHRHLSLSRLNTHSGKGRSQFSKNKDSSRNRDRESSRFKYETEKTENAELTEMEGTASKKSGKKDSTRKATSVISNYKRKPSLIPRNSTESKEEEEHYKERTEEEEHRGRTEEEQSDSTTSLNRAREIINMMMDMTDDDGHLEEEQIIDEFQPEEEADKIPQFETLISDDFQSDDTLASYTFMLEYIRRHIFENKNIKLEDLNLMLLGLYDSNKSEEINFSDFEQVLQKFDVNITQEEAVPLFMFLCKNWTENGSDNKVSLAKVHDSLVSYMNSYDEIHLDWFESFRYVGNTIKRKGTLQDLVDYLNENSKKYYINNDYLFEFLRNRFDINTDLIDQAFIKCGEAIYYNSIYIFNILNFLVFVMKKEGSIRDFQAIESLDYYGKFIDIIKMKVYERLKSIYKEKSDREILDVTITSLANFRLQRNLIELDLRNFDDTLKNLGIQNLSEWEQMVLFHHVFNISRNVKNIIRKDSKFDAENLKVFFKRLFASANPDDPDFMESELFSNTDYDDLIDRGDPRHSKKISREAKNLESIIKRAKESKDKFIRRPKLNSQKKQTNRQVYTFSIQIIGVENLQLTKACHYCDLSLLYTFPGDQECLESQIFTFVPEDVNYEVSLNSRHTVRCYKGKNILDLFGEQGGLRLYLSRIFKKRQEMIGFSIIPVEDLLSGGFKIKKFYLYPVGGDDNDENRSRFFNEDTGGLVIMKLDCDIEDEFLTEKDMYLKQNELNDENLFEKDISFERGLLPNGVFSLYFESLSRIRNVYQGVEKLVRVVFDEDNLDQVYEEHKYSLKIVVRVEARGISEDYLQIKDTEEDQEDNPEGPKSDRGEIYPIFKSFNIKISECVYTKKSELFAFTERVFCNTHLLNTYKHYDLEIDPIILRYIHEESMKISLLLINKDISIPLGVRGVRSPRANPKNAEIEIGSSYIPFSKIITIQNQDGYKATHYLHPPNGTQNKKIGYLGINLNYNKKDLEIQNVLIEESIRNAENEVRSYLGNLSCYLRLAELIQLSFSKTRIEDYVIFIKVKFGEKINESFILELPEDESMLKKIKFSNHDNSNDMIFDFNFGNLSDFISRPDLEKRIYDMKDKFDPLNILPKLRISIFKREIQYGDEEEELGYVEFDIARSIKQKSQEEKGDTWSLINNKNYVPLVISDKESQREITFRLGFDVFIVNRNKVKNSKIEKGLREMLGLSWLRSRKKMYNKLKSLRIKLETDEDGLPIITVASVKSLLRKIGKFPNFKIDSIMDMFVGKQEDKSEEVFIKSRRSLGQKKEEDANMVSLKKMDEEKKTRADWLEMFMVDPLMPNLAVEAESFVTRSSLMKELFDEFEYFDSTSDGFISFSDALKVYFRFNNKFKRLKRSKVEMFKLRKLCKDNFNSFSNRENLQEKFDYVVFLAELSSDIASYDLNDIFYKDAHEMVNKNLEYVNKISEKFRTNVIANPKNRPITQDINNLKYPYDEDKDISLAVVIQEGEYIDLLAHTAFPNTYIELDYRFQPCDKIKMESKSVKGEIFPRSCSPNWGTSVEIRTSNLIKFYKENKDEGVVVSVVMREFDRTGKQLFVLRSLVDGVVVKPFSVLDEFDIRGFLKKISEDYKGEKEVETSRDFELFVGKDKKSVLRGLVVLKKRRNFRYEGERGETVEDSEGKRESQTVKREVKEEDDEPEKILYEDYGVHQDNEVDLSHLSNALETLNELRKEESTEEKNDFDILMNEDYINSLKETIQFTKKKEYNDNKGGEESAKVERTSVGFENALLDIKQDMDDLNTFIEAKESNLEHSLRQSSQHQQLQQPQHQPKQEPREVNFDIKERFQEPEDEQEEQEELLNYFTQEQSQEEQPPTQEFPSFNQPEVEVIESSIDKTIQKPEEPKPENNSSLSNPFKKGTLISNVNSSDIKKGEPINTDESDIAASIRRRLKSSVLKEKDFERIGKIFNRQNFDELDDFDISDDDDLY